MASTERDVVTEARCYTYCFFILRVSRTKDWETQEARRFEITIKQENFVGFEILLICNIHGNKFCGFETDCIDNNIDSRSSWKEIFVDRPALQNP